MDQTDTVFVIFQGGQPTNSIEGEILIWRSQHDDSYTAQRMGAEGKDVTERLPQERWAALYAKAIAARTLLGRMPTNMIEEIF